MSTFIYGFPFYLHRHWSPQLDTALEEDVLHSFSGTDRSMSTLEKDGGKSCIEAWLALSWEILNSINQKFHYSIQGLSNHPRLQDALQERRCSLIILMMTKKTPLSSALNPHSSPQLFSTWLKTHSHPLTPYPAPVRSWHRHLCDSQICIFLWVSLVLPLLFPSPAFPFPLEIAKGESEAGNCQLALLKK